MQLIFTLTLNTDTEEVAFVGNVRPQAAIQMLQQLMISEAVRDAVKESGSKQKEEKEVEMGENKKEKENK